MRRKLVILAYLLLLAAALAPGQADDWRACHGFAFCAFPKTCEPWSSYLPCDAPYCAQDAEGNWFLHQRTERVRTCYDYLHRSCMEHTQGLFPYNTGIPCTP